MAPFLNEIPNWLSAPFARPGAAPSLLLAAVWFAVLRYFRYSGYGIAMLSVAGTVLHEASHYCAGLILRAKPVSVNLFPKRQGNNWVLGSVGFTGLNIFNSAFVGLAPLSLLVIAWGVFNWWLLPAYEANQLLSWFIAGYVAACAVFSSIPSSTDIKISALSAMMYGVIGYGIWFLAR